ncbi:hypothetical protein [Bradyrhizobium sp.]|uniref:hypothetical protein n=1 Tax=Bradyrhizobium sp. TaxID=376 RepID=UPI002DDCB084|nr:hypothetical protein [Bradyrhizobium sp.]HEV2159673.1 hypothetical protein [Bradyrhizobium sp.]
MTRFAALMCLGVGLGAGLGLNALAALPAQAQDSKDSGAVDRCFPWQEFRGGACVAKAAPLAPPVETQLPSPPAVPDRSETAVQPACPADSHLDAASNICVADALPPPIAPPRALITITCIGGTASNGQCACPAGFQLMPAGNDPGGTCVRTNAENCLGGAMTISGECLCNGQVTMSGQVYDLELSRGRCVPKRCPREGPCATAATKPEASPTSSSPGLSSDEPERSRTCAKGLVATRHGCVPARHRSQTIDPGTLLRMAPSYSSPMQY